MFLIETSTSVSLLNAINVYVNEVRCNGEFCSLLLQSQHLILKNVIPSWLFFTEEIKRYKSNATKVLCYQYHLCIAFCVFPGLVLNLLHNYRVYRVDMHFSGAASDSDAMEFYILYKSVTNMSVGHILTICTQTVLWNNISFFVLLPHCSCLILIFLLISTLQFVIYVEIFKQSFFFFFMFPLVR